ncbi:MAG: hypothetical protein Q9163_000759 [Psora crenata]
MAQERWQRFYLFSGFACGASKLRWAHAVQGAWEGFRADQRMLAASERLADAEASAAADHRRAQKDSHAFRSSIYPPGTEFALCHAETQLMAAVVGVLNESLTESVRGFYKLRKAYVTLDGILAAELRYMRKRDGLGADTPGGRSVDSLRSNRSARSIRGGFASSQAFVDLTKPPSIQSIDASHSHGAAKDVALRNRPTSLAEENKDTSEDEFYDADETQDHMELETYNGHLEIDGEINNPNETPTDNTTVTGHGQNLPQRKHPRAGQSLLDHDPDSDVFSNPIDVFIHSGANLCFGLLLVMLSMIPPALGKLLSIIGFHGDKDRGIRMLWQASKFHNFNGAMAGLILLGYYTTLAGFSDIVPDSDPATLEENPVDGYPKERCEALLVDMRTRHPKSHLWLLGEARMYAFNKQLSKAISILEVSTKSPLKQVEALQMFEKSLNAMYSHDYELCSRSFLTCVSLNNWSHALYYYIAGTAEVELYRRYKTSDAKIAKEHGDKAVKLLKLAPQHAGKKKFMARQLPFDVYVTRKIKKWEARAHALNVPFIDAVGISPLEEMIFFWNGYKRQNRPQLEMSLERIAWSETNPLWPQEGPDEKAVLAVLRAATLRNLGQLDEAEQTLRSLVLEVDRAELKGGLKDDWTAPAAHYEMGVICWMRRAEASKEHSDGEVEEMLVKECQTWIDKAAKWESYELDTRIGLKIATAQDTLKRWNENS